MRIFRKLDAGGFTVTEMVVVLAILGMLTVIALTTFSSVKEKGKVAAVQNHINLIDDALHKYAQTHQGRFPGFTDWPVTYSTSGRVRGNRIIGGNGGPTDDNSIVNQDDFLLDAKPSSSPFRSVLPKRYSINPGLPMKEQPMLPIDALYESNLMVPYPDNPMKPPGTGMVNVAYTLGSYHKNVNEFSMLAITMSNGPTRMGLAPGFPLSRSKPYRYSIFAYWWNYYTPNRTNKDNYQKGDFAYIPLGLSDPTGEYATDYWLIGYGDESTLKNSPYNQLLDNPNFPNFPPPLGDGNPTTPPVIGSYEDMVRGFIRGALVVKATKFEDQLSINRY